MDPNDMSEMRGDGRPPGAFPKEVAVAGALIARSLTIAGSVNGSGNRGLNPMWRLELSELIDGVPVAQANTICAVIDSLCLALNTAVSLSIDPSGERPDKDLHLARVDSLFRSIAEHN